MGGESGAPANQRRFAYAALCLVLSAAAIPINRLTGTGDPWLHTIIETVATFLALMVGALSLIRYYARNSLSYLILGTAFLGTGILNGFHATITSPFCTHCTPSSFHEVIPWSGIIPSTLLSLMMCGRVFAGGFEQAHAEGRVVVRDWAVYLAVGVAIIISCACCLVLPLPVAYYPDLPIHRPAALVPGLIASLTALGYFWKGAWKTHRFEHSLILFLIAAAVENSVYMPLSAHPYDAASWAVHALKILSFLFVLTGLGNSMLSIFRSTAQSLAAQERLNQSLELEIRHRQRVERDLQAAQRKLESRVAETVEELAEQDQLAALASRIALELTQENSMEVSLQRSAEILVHTLKAAFVRVWTLNRE